MKVLVTGATGFIGRRLVERLVRDGDEVIVLSRRGEAAKQALSLPVRAFGWDAMKGVPPAEALEGVEGVVHLAGEGVADKRWTESRKKEILESRTVGTRNLVKAVEGQRGKRVGAFVSASAIGIYGDRGDELLTEQSSPGTGFLADVCRAWEAEVKRLPGEVRETRVRIGIVLGVEGGALKKMLPPFRLGIGGPLGSGRQYMSWIHVDDLVGLLCHALRAPAVRGPVNGTAPEPVTNREFSHRLGEALGRPAVLPAPAFALRLLLGEMAEMLLGGSRVLPRAAETSGFSFAHPGLGGALESLLKKKIS